MNTISRDELSRSVSAIVVTRGDCDLTPILQRLPFDDIVVWDNSRRSQNLKVFGRFEAIKEARHPIIYTQDDDCLVDASCLLDHYTPNAIVSNVPRARRSFYRHGITLIGWGALFDAHLVKRFDRYLSRWPHDDLFNRECDRVFTALNSTICIEAPFRILDSGRPCNRMSTENHHWKDLADISARIVSLQTATPARRLRASQREDHMKALVKTAIQRTLASAGLELRRMHSDRTLLEAANPDCTDDEWATYDVVRDYTMTSFHRVIALIRAVKYICDYGIRGDFVECGVWRGGSAMAIARTLLAIGDTQRKLYLYDTFEGMSPPTAADVKFDGASAEHLLATSERAGTKRTSNIWAYAGVDEVRRNMLHTGYPEENVIIVKGPVEKTLPNTMPDSISLLRLDTDWYESTIHELRWLYPSVVPSGVVLIDDYGHWSGCRKAVDEFIKSLTTPIHLHRVDYTGRLFIKP